MRLSALALISLSMSLPLVACGDKDDDGSDTGSTADGTDGTADGTDGTDGSDGTETDSDGDGFPASEDCDDTNPDINPDAEEVCDEFDNDCNGEVDEGVTSTFYADGDGDGYAGASIMVEACEAPEGFSDEATDCDDLDASINPDGVEVCDGVDNDCDDLVDDDDDSLDTESLVAVYTDADEDGYGDDTTEAWACAAGSGQVEVGGDCDDAEATVNPETWWYIDFDGDGYGYAAVSTQACEAPSGYVADDTDCDETSAAINPGATEVCDDEDTDEDCSGAADDADAGVDVSTYSTFYADTDTDGYGDPETTVSQCDLPSAYVTDWSDCDDTDISVNPGETEVCNDGIDNDCSGDAPECGLNGSYTESDADAVLEGSSSGEDFAERLDVLDMNGDGYDDLVVGAWDYSSYTTDGGRAGLWLGPITASSDIDSADAVVYGDGYYDRVGYEVASGGDIDGDGYDDLLLGGYGEGSSAGYGTGWIVYGAATMTGSIAMSTAANATFSGPGNTYDYFAREAVGLGDIDADGYDDFAFGGSGIDTGASSGGAVYLFMGSSSAYSGDYDTTDAEITFLGDESSSYFGYRDTVASTDLDGDGNSDYVLGGYYANSYYGGAYIIYGSLSSGSYDITADADANLEGTGIYDLYGRRVFANPDGWDIDGDGYNDFAVWEYYAATNTGALYVYNGGATQWSGDYAGDTAAQFTLTGTGTYDYLGRSAVLDDLNGDGSADLAVGSGSYDGGTTGGGATFGWYGPTTVSGTIEASVTNDFAILGTGETYMYMGYYKMAAGDQNGDGVNDLFVGADGYGSYGGVLMFNGSGL